MRDPLLKTICFRVTEPLYQKIRRVSDARGEDVSDLIRRSVLKELASLNFLPEKQKKALGITEKEVKK